MAQSESTEVVRKTLDAFKIREIAAVWAENFEEFHLDLEEAIDAGNCVVALVHQRGRVMNGGALIEQRIGYEWELRDGRTMRVQVHFSLEEALAAAGVEREG